MCYTDNGRIPLKDKKKNCMCKQEYLSDKSTKIYIRKELVMMETTNSDFCTSFYIPAIQRLAFHLPHVRILGTNHYGELRHTSFKRRELFQDALCCRDYYYRLVANFARIIQSEYYGENISLSIDCIALEHCSVLPKANINSTTPSCQRHSVFHYFYLMISNKMLSLLLHAASV